ncbi:hypothetical protein AHOG_23510 [Actinoalloteichus hoggarensis]|uniref:Metal-binding protein n=2 Tax=Actinoalloteichus hoggarensis TaxID=1470176 RepID=A0A221W8G8_9PSEU|nr:hypothetical protein AHOG_23510 [Actinoalloteichus hoggarensis]
MSMHSRTSSDASPAPSGPWVLDTRELGRRAGASRRHHRSLAPTTRLGLDIIAVPDQGEVVLDLRLDSVVEGVLVAGTATAPLEGECSRCLDPILDEVEVEVTELFAYPESTTDETTDEDELPRVVDELIDLEPVVRDAILLALPSSPLCSPACAGLCVDCGGKWAELGPDHRHETMDPRWAALRQRFGDTSTAGTTFDKSEEN